MNVEIPNRTETISDRLSNLRRKKGLSLKQVAEALQISPSTYREWEFGRSISGEPYLKLAKLYGVRLSTLMYGESVSNDELIEELELLKNSLSRIMSKVISNE